ncbi:MAG: hypothetical protein NT079_05855, partial [Candidatus Omnitrophica bacterium]|nr:hypothetical protein [Candidatus Omnitrophota bacterium]
TDLLYLARFMALGSIKAQLLKACDVHSNFSTLGGFDSVKAKVRQLRKFRIFLALLIEASWLDKEEKVFILEKHYEYARKALTESYNNFLANRESIKKPDFSVEDVLDQYQEDILAYSKRLKNTRNERDFALIAYISNYCEDENSRDLRNSMEFFFPAKMRILQFLPWTIDIAPLLAFVFGDDAPKEIVKGMLPNFIESRLSLAFRGKLRADITAKIIDYRLHLFGHRIMAAHILKYVKGRILPSKQKSSADDTVTPVSPRPTLPARNDAGKSGDNIISQTNKTNSSNMGAASNISSLIPTIFFDKTPLKAVQEAIKTFGGDFGLVIKKRKKDLERGPILDNPEGQASRTPQE